MESNNTSIVDIVAQLEFRNEIIQSQGFSALISVLRKEVKVSHADEGFAKTVFFNCLNSYGIQVGAWTESCALQLVEKRFLCGSDVIQECLLRVEDSVSRPFCVNVILALSHDDIIRSSLLILRKCPDAAGVVIERLSVMQKSGDERIFSAFFALFLCADVSSTNKRRIVTFLILMESSLDDELKKHLQSFLSDLEGKKTSGSVTTSNPFEVAVNCRLEPHLLSASNLSRHHLFLPTLLSLYSSWSEIEKVCPGTYGAELITKVKVMLTECMKVAPVTESKSSSIDWNSFDYFANMVSRKDADSFVKMCSSIIAKESDVAYLTEESMLFACALLPHCQNPENGFELLAQMVKNSPTLANTVFPLYTLLLSRPYFPVERKTVLTAMRRLVTTRFLVVPVVKMLTVVSQQKTEDRYLALRLLGEMVTEFPTVFDLLLPLIDIGENDDKLWMEAKLDLMRTMFLAADRSDDLLPKLSSLLKKNGHVLTVAIRVLVDLCKEDILDLCVVRRQLNGKVRQRGNELALVQYCRLLSVAAMLKEDNEKVLRSDCLLELWQLKGEKNGAMENPPAVRAEAWRALGEFTLSEVREATSCSIATLSDAILSLGDIETEGFSYFLHRMLSFDVESLPRPLFTKEFKKDDVIVGNAATWYDALNRTNAESPWLWNSSLFLFSAIVRTKSESSRHTFALKLFRRLLCEVTIRDDSSCQDLIRLVAGWRVAVAEMVNMLAASRNGDYIWARDQLTEECGRALRQTEMSISNVLLAVTVLAREMYWRCDEITSSSDRISMEKSLRPWLVSVCQFVIPLTEPTSNSRAATANPVFQVNVASNAQSTRISRLCDWILHRITSNISLVQSNSYAATTEYNPLAELEGSMESEISQLIGRQTDDVTTTVTWTGGRSLLWVVGTAFGVDPLVLSEVDESISIDNEMTSQFDDLLNKDNGETTIEFVKSLLSISSDVSRQHVISNESKLRRKLERAWSNNNEFKRAIYEGLSNYCLSQWNRCRHTLPPDFSNLPEESLVRSVVNRICLGGLSSSQLSALLCSLAPLKRSDGRSLPPLDWAQLLRNKVDMTSGDAKLRLAVLRVACQESNHKLIFLMTSLSVLESCTDEYLEVLLDHLSTVLPVIPPKRRSLLLDRLYRLDGHDLQKEVEKALEVNMENQSVFAFLLSNLPSFSTYDASSCLENRLLRLVSNEKNQLKGKISRTFDVWLECNRKADNRSIDMSMLAEQYNSATMEQKDVILRMIGHSLCGSSAEELVERLLDLVSIHNIALKSQAENPEKSWLLPLFLTLICSGPASIPINWLSSSESVSILLNSRYLDHWQVLEESPAVEKILPKLRIFLVSLLTSCEGESSKRVLRGLLLSMVLHRPLSLNELLEMSQSELQQLTKLSMVV